VDSRENISYNLGGGVRKRFHYPWRFPRYFDLGSAAFVMTRETYNEGEPFPGVLPMASLGGQRLAINVTYVPEVDEQIIPVLFFQLKYALE